MLTSVIIGFGLGLAGSVLNHWLMIRAYKNSGTNPAKDSKKRFAGGFLLRQFINILILFLVRKDMWMLISAAIGLTMVKNYILILYTLGKKGVS